MSDLYAGKKVSTPPLVEQWHLDRADWWVYVKRGDNNVLAANVPGPGYLTATRPAQARKMAETVLGYSESLLHNWFGQLPECPALVLTYRQNLDQEGAVSVEPFQASDDRLLDLGFSHLVVTGHRRPRRQPFKLN